MSHSPSGTGSVLASTRCGRARRPRGTGRWRQELRAWRWRGRSSPTARRWRAWAHTARRCSRLA
eukprot:5702772-Prymnesium_polylepis.1